MSGREAIAEAVRARLDAVHAAGRRLDLWWRDDDAVAPSPALDRLIDAAAAAGVPLCLAVIPAGATPALARRLADAAQVSLSQHGYAHVNHAPPGDKAAELGDHRPADIVLAELARGRALLAALFGEQLLPLLTPPWNRIGETVAARRAEAGLPFLSTFAAAHRGDPACINTHIDIIDWKRGRRFAGTEKLLRILDEEIAARVGAPAPLGLLTHHLDHDEASWVFLDGFLAAAAHHPAVRWPPVAALLAGVTPPARSAAAASAHSSPR